MMQFLREPLFQFLAIGAVVFAAYSAIHNRSGESEPDTIVVTPGRVAQLAETFSRTWQRLPTRQELDSLVDAFIKEEIYYREGRKLGLDTDDTVFRRRLQQKMEFLMEPSAADLTPGAGVLRDFLEANRETYRVPPRIAFRQVYFDPDRRGDEAESDAGAALELLRKSGPGLDISELGDPTLLPAGMPLVPVDQIAISFGSEFADTLAGLPADIWSGPVRSTFGLHLVRVDASTDARDPDLAEVIDPLTRDWEDMRRRAIADKRYIELRDRYSVEVQMPEDSWPAADHAAESQ